ncbi:hypothetical protein CBL_06268 [Carabus blaptoides fortunei]
MKDEYNRCTAFSEWREISARIKGQFIGNGCEDTCSVMVKLTSWVQRMPLPAPCSNSLPARCIPQKRINFVRIPVVICTPSDFTRHKSKILSTQPRTKAMTGIIDASGHHQWSLNP